LGVPYLLWIYDRDNRRALLLGNRAEVNIHRPFEADDRELAEGALTVYIDVLLRKLAETTLRQAALAAEESNTVRARFLATLSHELRTPLNAIIGFSELLLADEAEGLGPAKREDFLRQILDAGGSLLTLVQDILDFSSFSNAAPRLRLDWIPLEQLMQTSVRALARETASGKLILEVTHSEPDVHALVDYDRFRQILSNIIGNSIKFTTPGGEIKVSLKLLESGLAEIQVRDTGIGMLSRDVPKALEPFVQLENRLSRRYPGTGLGLPIARQLVEAHQGRLIVESTLGEGTTVTVVLPAERVRLGPSEAISSEKAVE
jgi:signal transduction histidine kinase